MKTKPILFSTEMVQAILQDRKTQTRRTKGLYLFNVKPESFIYDGNHAADEEEDYDKNYHYMEMVDDKGKPSEFYIKVKCPYGKVGDILWVRETFTEWPKGKFWYKADTIIGEELGVWKPSIHMPKEACRLYLKITNFRIERLFDISKNDAIAEGVECKVIDGIKEFKNYLTQLHVFGKHSHPETPTVSFLSLWERINGTESVNSNPWVWVIEFEKCDKPLKF